MLGRRYDGTALRRYLVAFMGSILPPLRRTDVPAVLRRIAGMPDYSAYTEHLRRCHPERPVPSEREFYHEFVKARYEDSATRCC